MLRRLADISDAFKDVLQSTIKALFSSVLSDSQTLTDIIIISANFTDTSPKIINLVFKISVQELCELNCQNTSLGALVNNTIGDTIGNGAFAATLTNKTQAAIIANASLSDDPILSQTRYLNSTTGAATLEIVITLTETTRAPTSVPTTIPSTLGGGNHGNAGLIVKPAKYLTMTGGTAFTQPGNPGIYPAGLALMQQREQGPEKKHCTKNSLHNMKSTKKWNRH